MSPEHDEAYYDRQNADRAVNEVVVPDQTKLRGIVVDRWFTLHFTEHPVVDDVVTVEVTIERGSTLIGRPGSLILHVEEWDRFWRAMVDSTGGFDRRGISLVRTHPPDRI